MTKEEFTEQLDELLSNNIYGNDEYDKYNLVRHQAYKRYAKSYKPPIPKDSRYSSQDLDLILSMSPTEENIIHLSRSLNRSVDSIVQVYRHTYNDLPIVDEEQKKYIGRLRKALSRIGGCLSRR